MSRETSRTVRSRIAGFYRESVARRLGLLVEHGALGERARAFFTDGLGLTVRDADAMSENVIGVHGLPLGVALNFKVNERDFVVPMAVEEPSVVAAASNAARMARASGGFFGEADDPVMTAQVQLDEVPDVVGAAGRVREAREAVLAAGDGAIPRMVARGGGCRDLEVRVLDEAGGVLVVDLFVDVGEAMGANLCDAVAEAVAPVVHGIAGGRVGLRILSNLPMRRLVRVRCDVTSAELGGAHAADGVVRAGRFAELDPLRAVTHNKGFLNGLDAAAVALGQDWRAIEAGAHAYAARGGRYAPLTRWVRTEAGVRGTAELPLAVGTVGGSTRAHAGVRAAFEVVAVQGARELAVVLASVGLATNLASLRALAVEGIQQGHMALHRRKHGADAPRAEGAAQTAEVA